MLQIQPKSNRKNFAAPISVSENIYSEEPWKNESYNQAGHQEITTRLTSPTAAPLGEVSSPSIAEHSPFMPLLHKAAVVLARDVFRIHSTDFTTPAFSKTLQTIIHTEKITLIPYTGY